MIRKLIFISIVVFSNFTYATEWIDFEWEGSFVGETFYDKFALIVRVDDDKYLQLDTGSNRSYLYSPLYDFPGSKSFSFKLNEATKLFHNFQVHETKKQDGLTIGTLGADYFDEGLLIIDFPRQKFAKVNEMADFDFPVDAISWIKADVTDYLHISTSVKVGKFTFHPVLFDTGSSIFSLILNKKQWELIVSEKDRASPPLKLEVSSWGRMITLYGAEAIDPICLSSVCTDANVFYVDDPLMNLEDQGLEGLMGNAILRDEYTLVLDYKNKRIGFLKNK